MWEPAGGVPLTELPLVTQEQWVSINEVLTKTTSLDHLLVCSEFPFVDDCVEDAQYKASLPSHQHLGNQWASHGSELRKLLSALFWWKYVPSPSHTPPHKDILTCHC